MKRILLLITVSGLLSASAFSQAVKLYSTDGRLLNNSTVEVEIDKLNQEQKFPIYIQATPDIAGNLNIEPVYQDDCNADNTIHQYLFPESSASTREVFNKFNALLNPGEYFNSGKVTFLFTVEGNEEESVSLTIHFKNTKNNKTIIHSDEVSFGNPFPNPATDFVNLEYSIDVNESGKIEFYNIIGEKILEKEILPTQKKTQVDLRDIPPGIYIYRINIQGIKLKDGKIIKK